MKGLLLCLSDATEVAVKMIQLFTEKELAEEDKEYVKSCLEQKCFITNNQYDIGYSKALLEVMKAVSNIYDE